MNQVEAVSDKIFSIVTDLAEIITHRIEDVLYFLNEFTGFDRPRTTLKMENALLESWTRLRRV